MAWRYAILRLHEVVQNVVAHLTEADRKRFDTGLRDVFVDNYAAVPAESIRRLLALRRAGVIDILDTGYDYSKEIEGDGETHTGPRQPRARVRRRNFH